MGVYALAAAVIVKGVGSIMSGNAAKSEAYDQASQIEVQTKQRVRSIRYMARQTLSAARADYAAAGVDVNSGSPMVAANAISFNSEVDALNAMASGTAAANSIRRSGRAQANAGYINAAGSLLGGYAAGASYAGVSAGG